MSQKSQHAKEILKQIKYITIATVSDDGQPWNTPVFCAYDSSHNFYWASDIESQHSKNILENGKVFITIYDSTIPAGEGEAVYVKAMANGVVDPDEIIAAHELLRSRSSVLYWTLDQLQPSSPVRIFKAVPQEILVNDEGSKQGIYIDTRVEIAL